VVRSAYPDRALVVRPGLICGPHDPTGRFTYWPVRVARGGEVLAPGHPDDRIQSIDARDLAQWVVRMSEEHAGGTYNVAGPEPRPTIGELLETSRTVAAGSDCRLVWVTSDFLLDQGVQEWDELPLWVVDPEWSGLMDVDCSRAIAAGLEFRPLAETVRATFAWATGAATATSEEHGSPIDAGLSPGREAELLRVWRERGH
jgi:2'-hydroxyisoflavone reductase